jgi:hypothetical protein
MKIDPSQVQRTEEVTVADGRKYQRKIVRLTPEQRAEYRRMVAEEERDLPRRIKYRFLPDEGTFARRALPATPDRQVTSDFFHHPRRDVRSGLSCCLERHPGRAPDERRKTDGGKLRNERAARPKTCGVSANH